MTSKGNSKWNRHGRANAELELDKEAKETAIRGLDLRSALERYGVQFNQQGAALCPFHKEKTASFRIKNGSVRQYWHCFGCGESGELIKFARRRFGLGYYEALDTICRDFGLNTLKPSPADLERLDLMRMQRYNCIKRYEELVNTRMLCEDAYLLAWDTLKHVERIHGKSYDDDRYVSACFAVLSARSSVDKAMAACVQYLNDHPEAMPQVRTHNYESKRCVLPKAIL